MLVAGSAATAVVGGATIVLHWHYPSDVAGGVLVASFWYFGTLAAGRARPVAHARTRLTHVRPLDDRFHGEV